MIRLIVVNITPPLGIGDAARDNTVVGEGDCSHGDGNSDPPILAFSSSVISQEQSVFCFNENWSLEQQQQ